jgi:uncharacterized membrane protein
MDLTHIALLAGFLALMVIQAVSFAMQAKILQDIHTLTNQTLLSTQTTLEMAQAILREIQKD